MGSDVCFAPWMFKMAGSVTGGIILGLIVTDYTQTPTNEGLVFYPPTSIERTLLLSRVTVGRHLKNLKEKGIITIARGNKNYGRYISPNMDVITKATGLTYEDLHDGITKAMNISLTI